MIFFFQKIKIYWKFLTWCNKVNILPTQKHFYFWLCWTVDQQKEKIDKTKLIDYLVKNDTNNIIQMAFKNDFSWIHFILQFGFTGYRNQSHNELLRKYNTRKNNV